MVEKQNENENEKKEINFKMPKCTYINSKILKHTLKLSNAKLIIKLNRFFVLYIYIYIYIYIHNNNL